MQRWWWLGALPIGVALGLAIAAVLQPTPTTLEQSIPLTAEDPAVPADQPLEVLPDPKTPPPLDPAIATRRTRVGTRDFPVNASVPSAWIRYDIAAAEARWLVPGNPRFSHFIRIENVLSERRTIDEAIDLRVAALQESEDEFRLLERTSDTIKFSWVSEQHLRISYVRWFDPRAEGTAYAEVSIVGRTVDDAGMRRLLDRLNVTAVDPSSGATPTGTSPS